MKFFHKYVRKYWKMFTVALLFLMMEAVADLLLPTIMASVIDEGVADREISVVLRYGSLMLLITAFGAVGAATRNVLASRVSQAFGAELRSDLYRKIQTLSFAGSNQFERASLITRLTNDVTQVQNFVNGMMRIFAKAPILAAGSLIMAVRLDSRLAVVLAVIVPIIAILIVLQLKAGFPRFTRVQQAIDQVNRAMREYLSGVRVVKAFNRFDYEVEKFQATNDELKTKTMNVLRTMAVFSPTMMLTVNFGIVAVLWIGGLWVESGMLKIGVIIAFINYMTQILYALMLTSMVFTMFIRAKASAVRIGEVFAVQDRMTWETNTALEKDERGRVEFHDVSFSYEGMEGTPVLKHISFVSEPGQTIGIIGSTGSGKSSLVQLIPRFYDAVTGVVKVGGVDVRRVNPHDLRENIAVVPQKSILFTGTIIENIRWGNETATEEEVEAAARVACAHDFIVSLPEGYETRLGQRGVNLSGGQKQRISIARALVRKPAILILDDCTSAVDVETEAKIKQGLKTYAQNLTCILIAQRIVSVKDADQIIVMDEGEIVGIGTHDDLLKSCTVYQEIYRSQIGKEVQTSG